MLNLRGGYTWFTEDAAQRQAMEYDRSALGFRNLPGTYLPRIGLDQYNVPGSTTTSFGVGSDGRGTSDQTTSRIDRTSGSSTAFSSCRSGGTDCLDGTSRPW